MAIGTPGPSDPGTDVDGLVEQAAVLQLGGDAGAAIPLYRQALTADPAHHLANLGLCLALAAAGNAQEAFGSLARYAEAYASERTDAALQRMFANDQILNTGFDYDQLYAALWPAEVLRRRPFYNIGPGGFHHRHWQTIDKDSDAYPSAEFDIDIQFDLLDREPLPVESASAEVIYISHVISLIRDDDARHLFAEARRCLKPGGVFRVNTNDGDAFFRAYQTGDDAFFFWQAGDVDDGVPRSLGQKYLTYVNGHRALHSNAAATKLDDASLAQIVASAPYAEAMDQICAEIDLATLNARPNQSINWWNEAKLYGFLSDAGFAGIYRSGFGQSLCPVLRDTTVFDNTLYKVSLFMEARA